MRKLVSLALVAVMALAMCSTAIALGPISTFKPNQELRPSNLPQDFSLELGTADDEGNWTKSADGVLDSMVNNAFVACRVPGNITYPVVFVSSDPSVAAIDSVNGKLTPMKAGEVVITAYLQNTAHWNTVLVKVTGRPRPGAIDNPVTTRYEVLCSGLNLRKAPKMGNNVDSVMKKGTVVDVVEIANGWAKIESLGKTYYAYVNGGKYLAPIAE